MVGMALVLMLAVEDYYVAVDGKPEHDGSKEKPWPSVAFALSKVGGGRTILLRPGTYLGPIKVPKSASGTKERPTVLKSEVKWKAVVIGSRDHVISNSDDCDWLVVDGFEVMGAHSTGIKLSGDHNVARNNWVHNNAHMGISAHGRKGTIIENNLVEFNGQHPQLHHGVYASGENLLIRRNVVRHNAAFGLHLYKQISASRVEQNVVYGHVRKGGILVVCPEGGGKNVVVHNTVVDNVAGIDLWHGDGETVANNIILSSDGSPISMTQDSKNVRSENNLTTGELRFTDARHGIFWLRAGSPAIGKGAAEFAPEEDFWGRPRAADAAPDLGAFAFRSELDPKRAAWAPSSWSYSFGVHDERGGPPDFWTLK